MTDSLAANSVFNPSPNAWLDCAWLALERVPREPLHDETDLARERRLVHELVVLQSSGGDKKMNWMSNPRFDSMYVNERDR